MLIPFLFLPLVKDNVHLVILCLIFIQMCVLSFYLCIYLFFTGRTLFISKGMYQLWFISITYQHFSPFCTFTLKRKHEKIERSWQKPL